MALDSMSIRDLELAVIREAIAARRTLGGIFDTSALAKATDALVFGCEECNAGGHTCPGDGNPIPHGAGNCGEHDEPAPAIPNERRRLADYLSEYAHGVVEEWMRIVDVEEDIASPGAAQFQARARWQGDGTFTLGTDPYDDDFGRFRLTVKVDALPDPPPIGPENDPAQIEEARAGFCVECIEGDEDPHAWCDCGGDTERFGPCSPPCCSRAHTPGRCPSRTEWIGSTFLHIEQGDRLRIGQDEATVLSVFKSNWHADVSDSYRPQPWEHVELYADLGFGRSPFPTDTPVEILCDSERKAQLIMSEAGLKPRHA